MTIFVVNFKDCRTLVHYNEGENIYNAIREQFQDVGEEIEGSFKIQVYDHYIEDYLSVNLEKLSSYPDKTKLKVVVCQESSRKTVASRTMTIPDRPFLNMDLSATSFPDSVRAFLTSERLLMRNRENEDFMACLRDKILKYTL